ncbi:hypothetical protein B0T14DRAFT_479113, partial [Immersiella caudata]
MTSDSGPKTSTSSAPATFGSVQLPSLDATHFASGKGGGALRSIDQNFQVNPATGTLSLSVPFPVTPGRNNFHPSLSLGYDSGAGNGPFGLGWSLDMGSISRKTSHRIPQYGDGDEDVFVHAEGEDLVPVNYGEVGEQRGGYLVREYRLRVEQERGLRIERWTSMTNAGEVYWRTISGDQNITQIYGRSDESRVFRPAVHSDATKQIFSWLLVESYDAFGNAIHCAYKAEDWEGEEEDQKGSKLASGQTEDPRARMKYLKSIKYGNTTPCRHLDTWEIDHALIEAAKWCFEVVLDYGEHDAAAPTAAGAGKWLIRLDPFSSCKSGFELRTQRLCRRIMMFHHFEELGRKDYLVASSTLEYAENLFGAKLTTITLAGHIWEPAKGAYASESSAPLTFSYSALPALDTVQMQTTKPACLQSIVVLSGDTMTRWLDLDGEGSQGLLVQVNGAWYYQRNEMALNPGSTDAESDSEPEVDFDLIDGFGPIRCLDAFPAAVGQSQVDFADLDGNGKQDAVFLDEHGRGTGYCERSDGESLGWTPVREFPSILNKRLDDSRVKRADLTGDGLDDLLVVDNNTGEMVWHQSLGKDGFSPERRCHSGQKPRPRYYHDGGDSATYFLDMSGDGMVDIVEISNGRVSYWPNMGGGRFGREVVMGNAPIMESHDMFTFERLRFLDVDGSGTTDMMYLSPHGGALVYFNCCGNIWSEGVALPQFPRIEHLSTVFALDILGKGTASICWAGPDGGDGVPVIHYLDLAESGKPHLLTSFTNGRGLETKISYRPSTKFFLRDERAGRPWTTKLPFPVHVVGAVATRDTFTLASHVTKYAYHDGFYDGHEKEFRGFAMVETWEHERFQLASGEAKPYKRPVHHQKMWFHTGSTQLPLVPQGTFETPLVQTKLSTDRGWEAHYQAARALRGKQLRVEHYGLDGSLNATRPYSTIDNAYEVEVMLNPKDKRRPEVLRVSQIENVLCTYEREARSPRIEHELVLARNQYGDATKLAKIFLGRKPEPSQDAQLQESQQESQLTYTENQYTDPVNTPNDFYKPRIASSKNIHVLGLQLTRIVESRQLHNSSAPGKGLRRIRGKEKIILYRSEDLSGPLKLGEIEAGHVIMVDQELGMTLTRQEAEQAYGVGHKFLAGAPLESIMEEGGYLDPSHWNDAENPGDLSWWAHQGRVMFPKTKKVLAESELARARLSFFTPGESKDAFGNVSSVEMDRYWLLPVKFTDPVGNETTASNDYRTMQPTVIKDPNGNRVGMRYGPLGARVGSARLGKEGEQVGDILEENDVLGLDAETLVSILENPTEARARELLMGLGQRHLHSHRPLSVLGRMLPPLEIHLGRTNHHNGPVQEDARSPDRILMSVTYLGGLSISPVQVSAVSSWGKSGEDPAREWNITACVLHDSAGHVVKEHHPFNASDHLYRPLKSLQTPATLHFTDATGRELATLYPDFRWSKVTHTPWSSTTWAPGDTTSIQNPRDDPVIGVHLQSLHASLFPKTWLEASRDGDARSKLGAERSGLDHTMANPITSHYDIFGHVIAEHDSSRRVVQTRQYDRHGGTISLLSMDSGRQTTVFACDGKPIFSCDSRSAAQRMIYDEARRLVETRIRQARGKPMYTHSRTTWGESTDAPERNNLKGRVASIADQSGVRRVLEYDFKGNALRTTTQFARTYKDIIDCAKEMDLLPEAHENVSVHDALDRAWLTTDPLGRETRRSYDLLGRMNKLESRRLTDVKDSGWVSHISDTTYTADGLPSIIKRGNGCTTRFEYNTATRQAVRKKTQRRDGTMLENLDYTHDCYGRLVRISDAAQQTVFFRNNRVEPTRDYFYDQWSRLLRATGRELVSGEGQGSLSRNESNPVNPLSHMGLSNDNRRMVKYTETYTYDDADNIKQVCHEVSDAATAGWTREYGYQKNSNRLLTTEISGTTDHYSYDADSSNNAGLVGCITSTALFSRMDWDANKQLLSATKRGNPETTFYIYNSDGVRVRKVTETSSSPGGRDQSAMLKETRFLEGAEIQVKYDGNGTTARTTISTSLITKTAARGTAPVVLIEHTKVAQDDEGPDLLRYALSSGLEVDDQARVISYEEYSPFGSSTFAACRAGIEAPSRYRYASYRRDAETGFYHCGARYYLPGLGRWLSPDPLGTAGGQNLYCYCGNDPVNQIDPAGTMPREGEQNNEEEG